MLKVQFRTGEADPEGPMLWPLREGARAPEALRPAIAAAGYVAEAGKVLDLLGEQRRILAGLGLPLRRLDWEKAGAAAAGQLLDIPELEVMARGLRPDDIAAFCAGMALRAWRFTAHRTRDVKPALERLVVRVDDAEACETAWKRASASLRGCLMARDLVAEPANVLTTRSFATRLKALVEFGLEVEVWGRKRLAKAGFGALLAVGGGSAYPPRLVVLRWRGELAVPPVAFVGKGLVFDTGGISIKPAAGMEAMRADMAGAAACAGAMLALALRKSPAPAVAVLAIAENATGAESYRPGDVIRTASGRTVEVIDTDAEGRMVLADALHHAVSAFKPRAVIDAATLTGAIVTALGHHRAGLFGSDAALMSALAAAGEETGEALWPMPIGARHREDLKSDIADIKQCTTGRLQPDACHAAAFLSEFVGDVPWAHLDIAGVDTQGKAHALGPAGPTGFGVRLLDRLVAAQFEVEP